MNGGYVERNYLNIKRTSYSATNIGYERKRRTTVNNPQNEIHENNAERLVSARVSAKDKYKASSRVGTAVANGNTTQVTSAEKKGFVYVEHSGFAGTFRDAFCTKRVKSTEKSCFDKIVLVLLFAVLLFFVAGSYCEYYEAFKATKDIRSEISECRDERAKLLVALEERNNRVNIDEYAVNVLGMVKPDKLTKQYVNISEKDIVNITVTEEDENVSGGVLLSGFKSVISNVIGGN
ncbi:MAG: hypothetical protein IKI97_09900 [Clostridia bacterium]|nr:hypothetical protein [Clostridia bacterium]